MEKKILDECFRWNRPLPEAIKNAPDLILGLELFYVAFQELSSARQLGSMSEGPIGWNILAEYCQAHEIDGEQYEDFMFFLNRLDAVYLSYIARKQQAAASRGGKNGKGLRRPS